VNNSCETSEQEIFCCPLVIINVVRDITSLFSLLLLLYTWYISLHIVNPLNAELNPICYLLVLLGDLTLR